MRRFWYFDVSVWVSGGIWVVFMEIGGAWICLGGIRVLNPCSMEWKHYFGTALNGTVFCQLTILRHQNTKTAAYKLAKNDWVRPFFAIFRFIREILFVTVAFDRPVQHYMFPTLYTDDSKGHLTPIVQVSFSDLNLLWERSTEHAWKMKFGHLAWTPNPVDMANNCLASDIPSERSEHRLEYARDHGTHWKGHIASVVENVWWEGTWMRL